MDLRVSRRWEEVLHQQDRTRGSVPTVLERATADIHAAFHRALTIRRSTICLPATTQLGHRRLRNFAATTRLRVDEMPVHALLQGRFLRHGMPLMPGTVNV